MKQKTLRYILILSACSMCALFITSQTIVINTTPSVPRGIYLRENNFCTIERGDLVLLHPPDTPFFDEAQRYGLVPYGIYEGGNGYLIKYAVGIEGDIVELNDKGVSINGELQFNSTRQELGFDSPSLAHRQRLGPHDCWCMTSHPKSFDSRYFGVINKSAIVATLKPLCVE